MLLLKYIKWGIIVAIVWVAGYLLSNWITPQIDNLVITAGLQFTIAFWLGAITHKLGVLR